MNKDSYVLITGARGMVGTHLKNFLAAQGYLNIISPTSSELDLRDRIATQKYFSQNKIEFVFHLAAQVGGIQANIDQPVEFLRDNLLININLIDACFEYKITKLVNLGSSCIYPKLADQPMKEEALLSGYLEPTNEGYAISKIASLKLCQYYNTQYGTNFISIMPPNLYGPHEHFDPKHSHVMISLIVKFMEAHRKNELTVSVWGDGSARREFMHTQDIVHALVFAMNSLEIDDLFEKCFINVGPGEDISIRDLALLIKDIVGYKGSITFDPSKPSGMKQKLLDNRRSHEKGFSTKIMLREGIQEVVNSL